MRMWWSFALVLACQQSKPAPPPPPAPADAKSELVPIEKVPGLPYEGFDKAQRDCRPSQVVRRRFAGTMVKPCGTFPLDKEHDWQEADDKSALPCVEAAVKAKQPFIAEKEMRGTDSAVAHGLVGVLEHGELAMYTYSFDSNPCGGGCPEAGHTTVRRCRTFALPSQKNTTWCKFLFGCFDCNGDEITDVVENCVYVSPTPECVIDRTAQQACEAKGPAFAYDRRPSKFCTGQESTEAQRTADDKARTKAPCQCLDLVAERARNLDCARVGW